MAKKTQARKTAKPTLLRLRQIVDDDDTWSEIPIHACVAAGVGLKNVRRGDFVYVKGENVGWLADAALQKHGLSPRYTQHWVPDFRAWLKGDDWPTAQTWAGGEWPEGSRWRSKTDG